MKRICVAIMLICSSCSFLDVATVPIEKPRLDIQDPSTLSLEPIKVKSIDKNNVSLSLDDYKKLLINIDSIQVYILIMQDIINRYRDYYEPTK